MRKRETWFSLAVICCGVLVLVADVTVKSSVQNLAQSLVQKDEEDTRWNLASKLLNNGYPAKCVTDLLVDLTMAHHAVNAMTDSCILGFGRESTCHERSEGETEGRVGLGLHRLESCRRLVSEKKPAVLPRAQMLSWDPSQGSD